MDLSEEDEGWRCCKPYPRATEMVLVPQPVGSGSLLRPACLSTDFTTKRSCKRLHDCTHDDSITVFAFTFMHLADTFFQGNLHCIQGTLLIHAFPRNQTHAPLFKLQEICLQHLFTDYFAFSFLFYLHVFLYRSLEMLWTF